MANNEELERLRLGMFDERFKIISHNLRGVIRKQSQPSTFKHKRSVQNILFPF